MHRSERLNRPENGPPPARDPLRLALGMSGHSAPGGARGASMGIEPSGTPGELTTTLDQSANGLRIAGGVA